MILFRIVFKQRSWKVTTDRSILSWSLPSKSCETNWFSNKIRICVGQEDAADETCCAEDKTPRRNYSCSEEQGGKLHLDTTNRDWRCHCSSRWRNIRQEYSCRSHQVFGQSKIQVARVWQSDNRERTTLNCKKSLYPLHSEKATDTLSS